MAKVRIAINGFGRMGRLALREALSCAAERSGQQADYEIVMINDVAGDAQTAAHLLQFDSIHGRFAAPESPGSSVVSAELGSQGAASIRVGQRRFRYTSIGTIEARDWADIDVVIDCTGARRTTASFEPYFAAGVKKVVVSAPVKDGPLNVVYGVNQHLYKPESDHLVTAASCTTNCIAPVLGVLLKCFGVRRGAFTTIHALTNTQRLLDGFHKDLRRARSAATSVIPTSTGSATALFEIFPELRGRLDGLAVRVPVAQASLADCTFELNREVSAARVNEALAEAAENELSGILGVEQRPLVSIDYEGERRSAVVDALSTVVVDGALLKLLAWYDNETGYVARMMQLVTLVARTL